MSVRLLSGFKLSPVITDSAPGQPQLQHSALAPSPSEHHSVFGGASAALKRLSLSIGQMSPTGDAAHRKYALWGGK